MRIIDDILEISTLKTNMSKSNVQSVCLNELLSVLYYEYDIKAIDNNTPLYFKKGLSDKESVIYTEEDKLTKALDRLLENALKFTKTGYIEFGYLLKNNFINLYVKDTGIGINLDKQELIFNRFTQEDNQISRKFGGLGLGLSICKENVELLGGNISLNSKKGEGSTFIISIPYYPVQKKDGFMPKKPIREYKEEHTILIVEDEEVNYLYIKTLLIDKFDLKCKIILAKNGKEAVEICKANSDINIVLMDIKMRIMDGYKATKFIKKFRPELPVIAQTAYSTPADREKSKIAGCDEFVSKPINEKELKLIIDKYLKPKHLIAL